MPAHYTSMDFMSLLSYMRARIEEEAAMFFEQLRDPQSSTRTYLLGDPDSGEALLIDPVIEEIATYLELLERLKLKLVYTLETHLHADHVTASGELRERLGSQSVTGHQAHVSCANIQVRDGDSISIGNLVLRVLETPGHTDGCVSYVTSDNAMVFTGDALLINGCGRTDFQNGSSETLFQSVRAKLFELPESTTVYPGHDYQGRRLSTIGREKLLNARLKLDNDQEAFLDIMDNLNLPMPAKIDVALPANANCGESMTTEKPSANDAKDWCPTLYRTTDGIPECPIEFVDQRSDTVPLIDIREPDEAEGPLGIHAHARLIPKGEVDSVVQSESWNPDAPLLLICRSGRRSGILAQELERRGFTNVASVAGGMIAYRELESQALTNDE